MTNPFPRTNRRLADVLPPAVEGIQGNFCRTPSCPSFGIAPVLDGRASESPESIGRYSLRGPIRSTKLRCSACRRVHAIYANQALYDEYRRLQFRNQSLLSESCKNEDCENAARPANLHPGEYYRHGLTAAGKPRKRCKRCGTTITVGLEHKTKKRLGVNKLIVHDLVNRASLNAIIRKTGLSAKTLYQRIDFIHEQMIAFEASRLAALRSSPKFSARSFALCTDAQDHDVNWLSRDRREHIQLSCVATADNFTGFILRSDVNFDPLIGDCGLHFEELLQSGEFEIPELMRLSARYEMKPFLRAAKWCLGRQLQALGIAPAREAEIAKAVAAIGALDGALQKEPDSAGNPPRGVVIRKTYTAQAHFAALSAILPEKATLHHMTDPDGSLIVGLLGGMKERIRQGRADITLVTFSKGLSIPKKRVLIEAFKRELRAFAGRQHGILATATAFRRAFIREFARRSDNAMTGVAASWWVNPIETLYEPQKEVGIMLQRPAGSEEADDERRITLIDRSSLHAVDTFFNWIRQRVSYFHRPGISRSSGSTYNAFQPYRADMAQKMIDIARVYYNWVEPRPFRIGKKFENIEQELAQSAHETLEAMDREKTRSSRKAERTTPAMRLGLARGPVTLETILYQDWRSTAVLADAERTSGGAGTQISI